MQGEQGLRSSDVQNKDTETSPAVPGLFRSSISACHTRKVWATLLTDGFNARAFCHREVKEPTPSLTNCASKLNSNHCIQGSHKVLTMQFIPVHSGDPRKSLNRMQMTSDNTCSDTSVVCTK